jgi:hypothetical protein
MEADHLVRRRLQWCGATDFSNSIPNPPCTLVSIQRRVGLYVNLDSAASESPAFRSSSPDHGESATAEHNATIVSMALRVAANPRRRAISLAQRSDWQVQ